MHKQIRIIMLILIILHMVFYILSETLSIYRIL